MIKIYIITNNDNIVFENGVELKYLSEEMISIDGLRMSKQIANGIYEVDSIPTDYVQGKYKYTTESGFTLNESWKEPITMDSLKEENKNLKEKLSTQEKAITELTMIVSTMMM